MDMARGLFDRRRRYLLYKLWALLSLVRWYNVLIVAIALYLSAIFIFNPQHSPRVVLSDWKLHAEVIALCLFIMSGYIINAFYDVEKDLINRPQRTFFDKHISREFSFNCYFGFNTLAGILSLIVSLPVAAVNILFSFVLWFYSHKMRRKPMVGEVATAMLTVAPFFSLTIFYWNISKKMIEYVAFIFILIVARGVIKKLIGMKGDIIFGDRSVAVVYGEKKAKWIVLILSALSIGQILFFIRYLFDGPVQYYFVGVIVLLMLRKTADYKLVNLMFKLLLISAVFCIPFV